MDVSETLVDAMLSIEPSKIKILTVSELEFFRLDGIDANWDEKMTAKNARQYNLTSSEYRKKHIISFEKCWNSTDKNLDILKCDYMTFLAITSQEYDSRKSRVSKCLGKEPDNKIYESCMFKTLVLNQ